MNKELSTRINNDLDTIEDYRRHMTEGDYQQYLRYQEGEIDMEDFFLYRRNNYINSLLLKATSEQLNNMIDHKPILKVNY